MNKIILPVILIIACTPIWGQNLVPSNLIMTNDTGFCPPATFDLQAVGGGGCEYSLESIPYNTQPVGGTSVSMWDDQLLGPYPIGFTFDFYCNSYSQFYICSNGWIGFTAGQNQTWVVNPVPSMAFNVPRNVIMMPWRDWNPGVAGGPYITYQVQGVAPFRRLVVTYSAVPMFLCTTTYGTFQTVLYETTNVIEQNLTNVPVCLSWGNGDGTQALHNLPGTFADIVLGRNDNTFTATNESWRFNLPKVEWIYQGDTVGEGPTLEVSPANGVYPEDCEYVYAILDSANGNIAIDSVLISPFCQVPQFIVNDVLCNGDSTGWAVVEDTTQNSMLPMAFYWMDNSGDTIKSSIKMSKFDTLSGLKAGSYSIKIIDGSGCYITTGTFMVDEPPVLVASISNATAVSCPGGQTCDASALGSGSGGVSPYYFIWSTNEPTQIATQLCPDSNFVTVTDAHGCTDDQFIIIDVPDTIVTTAFGDTTICITNPAAIAAASTGGTPPYSYVWTEGSLTGPVISTSANETVFPIITKQYFVTSTDANGCSGDSAEVIVRVRDSLSAEIPEVDTICPYDTINLFVQGFGGDSNYTYAWSTGDFGAFTEVSPDVPKWYQVTVSDACGTPSITDSVFVQVGGYSRIKVDIQMQDDSICVGENLYLIASGQGGFRGPDEYRFEWSDPAMDGNPIQFVQPEQTSTYTVTITDLCLSPAGTATRTVYVGHPYMPEFKSLPSESCSNEEIAFTFGALRFGHQYTWDFGDGSTMFSGFSDTVYHQYKDVGCYDVSLAVTTDFGCYSKYTKKCLVEILQSPLAAFSHFPTHPNTMDPMVKFTDQSKLSSEIWWYLNGDTLSTEPTFVHEFIDTGKYEVSLVAISKDGCVDTISKELHHVTEQTIYLPSSFTPNGDGLNDIFKVEGELISKKDFDFIIYDRWGKILFRSTNPDYGWNGRYTPQSEFVPIGSYPYTIRYRDRFGELHIIQDQVTITSNGDAAGGLR